MFWDLEDPSLENLRNLYNNQTRTCAGEEGRVGGARDRTIISLLTLLRLQEKRNWKENALTLHYKVELCLFIRQRRDTRDSIQKDTRGEDLLLRIERKNFWCSISYCMNKRNNKESMTTEWPVQLSVFLTCLYLCHAASGYSVGLGVVPEHLAITE